jgi:hypothetical protein
MNVTSVKATRLRNFSGGTDQPAADFSQLKMVTVGHPTNLGESQTASLTFTCRSSSPALKLALRIRRLPNATERTCLCGLVVGVVSSPQSEAVQP